MATPGRIHTLSNAIIVAVSVCTDTCWSRISRGVPPWTRWLLTPGSTRPTCTPSPAHSCPHCPACPLTTSSCRLCSPPASGLERPSQPPERHRAVSVQSARRPAIGHSPASLVNDRQLTSHVFSLSAAAAHPACHPVIRSSQLYSLTVNGHLVSQNLTSHPRISGKPSGHFALLAKSNCKKKNERLNPTCMLRQKSFAITSVVHPLRKMSTEGVTREGRLLILRPMPMRSMNEGTTALFGLT